MDDVKDLLYTIAHRGYRQRKWRYWGVFADYTAAENRGKMMSKACGWREWIILQYSFRQMM